jgi:hydroxypyruvate isomerase
MSSLYISNLCSDVNNFKYFLNTIVKFRNINGIDVAPLNIFKNWSDAEYHVKKIYKSIKYKKLKVNAIQGVFYKKNFTLENNFSKPNNDDKVIEHFKKIVKLCMIFKCKKIIFGSAEFRNRKKCSLNYTNIFFKKFLNKIIPILEKNKIYFCIETIPKIYNSNYLYKIEQTCKLVKSINNEYIKINFDSAIFFNVKFNKKLFLNNINLIENIQISEPFFKFFIKPNSYNINFAGILKKINYKGTVSLEIISKKFKKNQVSNSINNFIKLFGN